MSKKYVFNIFLNIDNIPDARMFTGNSFNSRGAAEPNAESPINVLVGAYFWRRRPSRFRG